MFALVLQKLVSTIEADDEYLQVLMTVCLQVEEGLQSNVLCILLKNCDLILVVS